LDSVNDPDEGLSTDLNETATAVFTTCWTGEDKESIPLWSLYTGGMQGIRLSFPTNFLAGRYLSVGEFELEPVTHLENSILIHRDSNRLIDATTLIYGPAKVLYTDDDELLRPRVYISDPMRTGYELFQVGLAKRSYWSFEAEWRYRIFAIHEALISPHFRESLNPNSEWLQEYLDLVDIPVQENYIDVPLRKGIWNSAHIVIGPKSTTDDKLEVESLLTQYNCAASVSLSGIRIR
jgi:hypothetical protein